MEPKPSPPALPPATATATPTTYRRRGKPNKRKAKATKPSSPSPPPKRQARDRHPSSDLDDAQDLPPVAQEAEAVHTFAGEERSSNMEPKPLPPIFCRRRKPKRKAQAAKPSSLTPPPKRQARERDPSDLPPPHTRPLTRATRQSPLNPVQELEPAPCAQEAAKLPSASEEVEAVLSRGAGVHVVPTFAGWFSWKEIHQIEKQALPSFFDGVSLQRTPEIYLGIRNFIMKKFHANPQMHLEFKDLSELSDGEMDARLEVFSCHTGI